MAYRKVRTEEDEVLRKVSKEVKKFDESLWALLDDMADTMYEENGVGLAAPQVGILKRIFVIDIGEGLIEFINPTVIATEGEQFGEEGCLSVPNKYGNVRRPNYVKMRAQDRNGNFFEIDFARIHLVFRSAVDGDKACACVLHTTGKIRRN